MLETIYFFNRPSIASIADILRFILPPTGPSQHIFSSSSKHPKKQIIWKASLFGKTFLKDNANTLQYMDSEGA